MINFTLKKDTREDSEKERDELMKNIALAYKEWKDKENYFEAVIDHDLIDYAIYEIEASRKKYLYLLRKMKETNEYKERNKSNNTSIANS